MKKMVKGGGGGEEYYGGNPVAGDDCGNKGQHDVESVLRDVLMQTALLTFWSI